MNPSEVVDVGEPGAEELVRPALGLKYLDGKQWVVINSVDDHLHQVDPIRFSPRLAVVDNVHCKLDEDRNILVNIAAKVEHDGLRKLAAAYSVDTAHFVVVENIFHHADDGSEISWVLDQVLCAIGDEVVKGR